jgi:hypothetical protein
MKTRVEVVWWYLRGVPLLVRLVWTGLGGTDEQFGQAAADIDALHEQRPGRGLT